MAFLRVPQEVYQGRGPAETAQRVWAWNQTHPLACGSRHFPYSSSLAPVANICPPPLLEQAASEMPATPEAYDSGGLTATISWFTDTSQGLYTRFISRPRLTIETMDRFRVTL
ncbi:hypothetical protein E8E15_008104 [Penicillium rubens]|nr:hypothetical protein E8E15_008104 [Penicillium rubens]KAJ5841898.1 hypothetical protein N7534_011728 [Penicillium rubens]KZN89467.1 hypothetical protein EN45_080740 [Penicillium chrysogenum]